MTKSPFNIIDQGNSTSTTYINDTMKEEEKAGCVAILPRSRHNIYIIVLDKKIRYSVLIDHGTIGRRINLQQRTATDTSNSLKKDARVIFHPPKIATVTSCAMKNHTEIGILVSLAWRDSFSLNSPIVAILPANGIEHRFSSVMKLVL